MKTESTETQEKKLETLEEATMNVLNEASSWKDAGFGSSVWLGKERAKRIAQSREQMGSDGPLKTELSKAADIIHKLYSNRRAEIIQRAKRTHDIEQSRANNAILNNKKKNPNRYTMWEVVNSGYGLDKLDHTYQMLMSYLKDFDQFLTKDDTEIRGDLDFNAVEKGFSNKDIKV